MDRILLITTRIASYFIDLIIYALIYLALSNFGVYGYLISIIVFFIYKVVMEWLFGQTVGMMLLKLKLKNYSFYIALKREIMRIASSFYYIGYIYALFDKKLRTFHDLSADTYVDYVDKNFEQEKTNRYIIFLVYVILVISSVKMVSSFVINDIGNIGLNKYLTSDDYFQSFEGDNLVSLSQDELYLKTVGRRYIAIINENGKKTIYRISNKLKYTEFYRLNQKNNELVGEYRFKVDVPIQFISGGNFIDSSEFCAISPKGELIIIKNDGSVYSRLKINYKDTINLKTGDIDKDGKDEVFVLNRNGEISIYKVNQQKITSIYNGKIGEDIVPFAFLIEDDSLLVFAKGDNKMNVYKYSYLNNRFEYKSKKTLKIKEISNAFKFNKQYLLNHLSRNNMTFKVGNIQTFEVYNLQFKRLYNFGKRPAKRYAYMVNIVEGVCDLDDDGVDEIIVKAVGKDDVMGQAYKIIVYKQNKLMLFINKILSMWAWQNITNFIHLY